MSARKKDHLRVVRDEGVEPYAFSARAYFRAGWSPLPLPPGQKSYPPTGYTGSKGRAAEPKVVEYWISKKGNGNVALRMPPGLIGVDVDNYGDKAGAATLARAEEEWGALPPTWRTTSRTDGTSGIRLYRIPEALSWPGKLPQGGGIELCRWDHRYVIVAPSIHDQTGEQYHWFNPAGERTTGVAAEDGEWEFPSLEELPALPAAWVEGLTSGKKWIERPEADLEPGEVTQWILDRPGGEPCEKMQRTLDLWMSKVSAGGEDGGAHDAARDGAWAVLRDAAAGHGGVQKALKRLMLAHKEALRSRRPEKAASEWASIKARGVQKVAAEGPTDDDDPCAVSAVSREATRRNRGSDGMDFARTDPGNARRLVMRYRESIRFVDGLGGWMIWDRNRWSLDIDGEIKRMGIATVEAMDDEAKYIEDPKDKAAFLKFARASTAEGRMNSMISLARAMKGITLPSSAFDSDPRILVVGNGTIELGESRARFRSSRQEDYNTMATPVQYKAGAVSDLWEKFLARSIPDEEVRDWVQRAAGYSMYGGNPERVFFIIEGASSSGKSTFVEIMRAVLGDYGATFELNLFRTQKEQGPNVQLVRLLPKRFVVASEASAEQFLHADQLKRVTGGEALSGRLNRANEMIERVPSFTPWLATNAAPTIRGADQALYRRMYTIPFNESIPENEVETGFTDRLRREGAEGVLAWLVAGWDKYCAEGLRNLPAALVKATMKTREELSDFDVWLTEDTQRAAEYSATTTDLYAGYRDWCTSVEVRPESQIEFGRMLGKRGFNRAQVRVSKTDRNKKARGWAGIRLARESEKSDA